MSWLPEAFGRRDSSGYERRRGGGLRTGGERRRDSFPFASDDRGREDRRSDRWGSPSRDWERSPRSPVRRRSRSRSPIRGRSRSPIRGRSRSPIRGRSRSPIRGRSRSPIRGRSRSPIRGRSRSPRRDWSDHGSREYGRDRRDDRDDWDDRRDRIRNDRGNGSGTTGGGRYDGRSGPPVGVEEDWHHHLNPASAEEGPVARVAGCLFRASEPTVDLWVALELGITDRVIELIQTEGSDVNEQGGPYGCTPLAWAAFRGDAPLASRLLELSADVNIPARKGAYPLHMAVWNGDHVEVVDLLLRSGAMVNVRNRNGQTPLEQAEWFDKLEREALVEQVYLVDEWRTRCCKPAAGRALAIKALMAAAGEASDGINEGDGVLDGESSKEIADTEVDGAESYNKRAAEGDSPRRAGAGVKYGSPMPELDMGDEGMEDMIL